MSDMLTFSLPIFLTRLVSLNLSEMLFQLPVDSRALLERCVKLITWLKFLLSHAK